MSDPLHFTPGTQFGRLTILARAPNSGVVCRCICGNLTTVKGYRLKTGRTRSCGCLRRRLAHEGETMSVTAWANAMGLTPSTLRYRLRRGWTVERALNTPARRAPPPTY